MTFPSFCASRWERRNKTAVWFVPWKMSWQNPSFHSKRDANRFILLTCYQPSSRGDHGWFFRFRHCCGQQRFQFLPLQYFLLFQDIGNPSQLVTVFPDDLDRGFITGSCLLYTSDAADDLLCVD